MKTSYCIQRILPESKKVKDDKTLTYIYLYEDPNISLYMSLVTTFCEGIFLETNPGGIPVVLFDVNGIFALF